MKRPGDPKVVLPAIAKNIFSVSGEQIILNRFWMETTFFSKFFAKKNYPEKLPGELFRKTFEKIVPAGKEKKVFRIILKKLPGNEKYPAKKFSRKNSVKKCPDRGSLIISPGNKYKSNVNVSDSTSIFS
jgi:hypothetical protein